ncbi:MAG: GNAT family N-acetyltransferase [Anaerolineaceae bacterium]|nr:GNAT family N-acetyltransferase [Anaerolineaceae bacterium]
MRRWVKVREAGEMPEVVIRPFTTTDLPQLPTVITGYVTHEKYVVQKMETEAETAVTLKLVTLPGPKTFTYDHLDEAELDRLAGIVAEGFSFGAFVGKQLVGAALASPEHWNGSLRVWEFHVQETWRGQGLGRRLMEQVVETAVTHHLRVIVCETQSSNVPAIRAYRRLGFVLDAVDLSFYSNEDVQKESVAVFMKRYVI